MKTFRQWISEGDVVKFVPKAIKTNIDTHKTHEETFESNSKSAKTNDEVISHANGLLTHIMKTHGIALMQKGIPNDPKEFRNGLLNISKGLRTALADGAKYGTYPAHQIYMGQKHNRAFEDGYSGETGIAINHNSSPEELSNFFKEHSKRKIP